MTFGVAIVAIIVAVIAFSTWLWMVAWNAVVAGIFHGPTITYFQAFMLSLFVGMVGNAFKSVAVKAA